MSFDGLLRPVNSFFIAPGCISFHGQYFTGFFLTSSNSVLAIDVKASSEICGFQSDHNGKMFSSDECFFSSESLCLIVR